MNVIDLTHPISEVMTVYPGSESPILRNLANIEVDGYREQKLTFSSHTGTHVDAPAHMLPAGKALDRLTPDHFCGPGLRLDFTENEKSSIELHDLVLFEQDIRKCEFVLLQTGWSRHWASPAYFSRYPVLTEESAQWLAGLNLKGVGVDTISVDEMYSTGCPVHKAFFAEEMVIVENLTNLESIGGKSFLFCSFPLRLEGGDGSPVRAVALFQ